MEQTEPDAPISPPLPERPIRYGVTDLFATVVLFGVHLAVAKAYLIDSGHPASRTERMFCAAAMGAAFAFGSAYLSFRYATKHDVESHWRRVFYLICFDLLLMSIPLVVFAIVYEFPVVVLSALCFLILVAPIILLNPGRGKK
jgi:hypothetical protein